MDINAPIGVFDSGVGGLTVVREDPYASCPMKNVVYFGDTARVPLWQQIRKLLLNIPDRLFIF